MGYLVGRYDCGEAEEVQLVLPHPTGGRTAADLIARVKELAA